MAPCGWHAATASTKVSYRLRSERQRKSPAGSHTLVHKYLQFTLRMPLHPHLVYCLHIPCIVSKSLVLYAHALPPAGTHSHTCKHRCISYSRAHFFALRIFHTSPVHRRDLSLRRAHQERLASPNMHLHSVDCLFFMSVMFRAGVLRDFFLADALFPLSLSLPPYPFLPLLTGAANTKERRAPLGRSQRVMMASAHVSSSPPSSPHISSIASAMRANIYKYQSV